MIAAVRPFVFAAALAVAPLSGAVAGAPCVDPTAGPSNPAFGTPRACPPKPAPAAKVPAAGSPFAKAPAAAPAKPAWVRTPDGRTRWTDGNTSISVGGYVRYDYSVHDSR